MEPHGIERRAVAVLTTASLKIEERRVEPAGSEQLFVRARFRPEFLNRIDEIVSLHALGLEHVGAIVDIQLKGVQKRLFDRKLTLSLTKAAKDLLAEQGFDPTFGARPLKRTIQRLVENPLAVQVLAGTDHEGDTVLVDARDGALTFDKEQVATAASRLTPARCTSEVYRDPRGMPLRA